MRWRRLTLPSTQGWKGNEASPVPQTTSICLNLIFQKLYHDSSAPLGPEIADQVSEMTSSTTRRTSDRQNRLDEGFV